MALPLLARGLAAAGRNALRFDFTGNGASGGAMRFANFQREVDDIAAAKAFLETELRQRVTGLLGAFFGSVWLPNDDEFCFLRVCVFHRGGRGLCSQLTTAEPTPRPTKQATAKGATWCCSMRQSTATSRG
jgi:hypothetical protein